jgi:hypothetical protein
MKLEGIETADTTTIEMIQQDHANQERLEIALERQFAASNPISRFIAKLAVARIESSL